MGHWHIPMLAVALALGCAAHIAGDELTHGGCPVFWPFSMHEFHLLPKPFQFTTAKLCETWIIFPLLVVGLGLALWHDTGHSLRLSSPAKTHTASAPRAHAASSTQARTASATQARTASATQAHTASATRVHPVSSPLAHAASRRP